MDAVGIGTGIGQHLDKATIAEQCGNSVHDVDPAGVCPLRDLGECPGGLVKTAYRLRALIASEQCENYAAFGDVH
jgi:hypothetical protein